MTESKKTKRRKPEDRWAQNNYLVDEVCPHLKTATYGMILMTCFRHGRGLGYFRASVRRIAKSAVSSPRHVHRVLREFEQIGLIEVVKGPVGVIPKTYRIRFVYQDGALSIPTYNPKSGATDAKKRQSVSA